MKKKVSKQLSKGKSSQKYQHNSLAKQCKSAYQSFHLQEDFPAEQAKNDLFYEAENFDYAKERKVMNKTHHNFHQRIQNQFLESWYGESVTNTNNPEKIVTPFKAKIVQTQNKVTQKKLMEIELKRSLIKSAIQLRDQKKNIESLKKSLYSICGFVPQHKQVIMLTPTKVFSSSPSKKQIGSFSRKKRAIKSAYISLNQQGSVTPRHTHNRVSSQNFSNLSTSLNIEKKKKMENIKFQPHMSLIQTGQNQNKIKGMYGSLLKHKNAKKGKWIQSKDKIANISRVYELNNSKIKDDIGKILNLIKKESQFENAQFTFS